MRDKLDRHIRYRARADLLPKQGSRCALCGSRDYLEVDHDHETGLVRGMLCGHCNKVLGAWQNRRFTIKALRDYLSQPQIDYLRQTERVTREQMFMNVAQEFSTRSTCLRKHVGAVFVRDNRVIAHGYNGAPSGMAHCLDEGCIIGPDGGCIRSLHAEMNALMHAAKKGVSTEGAVAYMTLAPCPACAAMLVSAGVSKVYYREEYRDTRGLELLRLAGVRVARL